MKRAVSAFLLLLIFLLGVSFSLANQGKEIAVQYYFGVDVGPYPLSLVLIVVFLGGALIGGILGGLPLLHRRREARRLRKRMEDMEQELSRLRQLPLRDEP